MKFPKLDHEYQSALKIAVLGLVNTNNKVSLFLTMVTNWQINSDINGQ